MRFLNSLAAIALSGLVNVVMAASPELLKSEFIYETASFPSCHASTIVETSGGKLVVAWFGGTREKHPDVGIWVSRLDDSNWTAPVEVATGVQKNGTRLPCWNPVLFQPDGESLMLFYKVGPDPSSWWGFLQKSDDDGATWSVPQRLPEGFVGPIKNKPVQLSNGEILCPSSSEDDGWRVHIERTSDLGLTWSTTGALNNGIDIGAIQPSILMHGNKELQAIGRTRQGKLFSIDSFDGGKTWETMTLTALPNPNSGTDALTLANGRHLLIYNHTSKNRSPLNLAISRDGRSWDAALVLENEAGEFSYPAVIQTRDKLVHATYTWKREKIKHIVLDPATLGGNPIRDGQWP